MNIVPLQAGRRAKNLGEDMKPRVRESRDMGNHTDLGFNLVVSKVFTQINKYETRNLQVLVNIIQYHHIKKTKFTSHIMLES